MAAKERDEKAAEETMGDVEEETANRHAASAKKGEKANGKHKKGKG